MALMAGMGDVIETILNAHFPDRVVEARNQLPHGQVHTVYRVTFAEDEPVVIKLCQEHRFAERFGRELDLLPYLYNTGVIPVPEPLHVDRSRETVPYRYMIMEHVAGENGAGAVPTFTPKARAAFMEDAGRLLARLHDHAAFDACGYPAVTDGTVSVVDTQPWTQLYRQKLATAINGIGRTRFGDLVPRLSDAADTAAARLDEADAPRLLKNDHAPGNMIVREGAIAAVLDWEGTLVGPARYDAVQAERKCVERYADDDAERLRTAFQDGYESLRPYPAVPDAERRVYRFGAILGHLWGFPWSMQDASAPEREERADTLRDRLGDMLDAFQS